MSASHSIASSVTLTGESITFDKPMEDKSIDHKSIDDKSTTFGRFARSLFSLSFQDAWTGFDY